MVGSAGMPQNMDTDTFYACFLQILIVDVVVKTPNWRVVSGLRSFQTQEELDNGGGRMGCARLPPIVRAYAAVADRSFPK